MSKTPVKPTAKPDPRFTQAVQNFEAAMKALQGQKFDRAKALLEKVMEGPSKEHAERARVYLNICVQHLARTTTNFRTPEEHYDYAVALMNNLDYNGARSHLEKILRQHPKADYAVYGLAVLECLQSRVEESLRRLEQAIKLNPNNRIQARNDSDFVNMADDPRFTELIYPEPGEMASSLSHPKNR
ncbi:MAG: tetratricopeptide repeat protein [Acidobacteriales bacterium]|nr:tetratricopeptide repeat protein [Terriglobales bacterium]